MGNVCCAQQIYLLYFLHLSYTTFSLYVHICCMKLPLLQLLHTILCLQEWNVVFHIWWLHLCFYSARTKNSMHIYVWYPSRGGKSYIWTMTYLFSHEFIYTLTILSYDLGDGLQNQLNWLTISTLRKVIMKTEYQKPENLVKPVSKTTSTAFWPQKRLPLLLTTTTDWYYILRILSSEILT